MDQSLLYRSVLRVSAVVFALILVFQSGLVDERTAAVFATATDNLHATVVGASASVRSTEINTITAELTKQQQLLVGREQEIVAREIELGLASGEEVTSSSQTTTYILAAILLIQLVLLVLNYLLDYLRVREQNVMATATAQV